jgi:GT2 family glycosyltransferase
MADNPRVSIIILNYNGLGYLKDCLASLNSQTYPNFRIIVCDNASKDGTAEFLTKNFPNVTLIRNNKNLGFAKGNNIAIDYALKEGDDYIFLLNNDTIVEPDSLGKLVKTAESDDSVGIVGPMVFDLKNKCFVQEAGMSIDKFGYPVPVKGEQNNRNRIVSEVFFVSGCALLIKKEVLQKIGYFDDEYFMFAEDLDLCWRAQLAGYKVVVNKESRIYHASGGSISGGVAKTKHYSTDVRRIFLREKNTIRTLIKNYDSYDMIQIVSFYVTLLIFESMFWFCILKPETAKNILKAIFWNIKFLPNTFQQRVLVQRLRKVKDREIVKKMMKGYNKLSIFKTVGVPSFE